MRFVWVSNFGLLLSGQNHRDFILCDVCSMSMFIVNVIHLTLFLSDWSHCKYDTKHCQWLVLTFGWCVSSDQSQHILNSHDLRVRSILLETPHVDWAASQRIYPSSACEIWIIYCNEANSSEITFIFQHFSNQSHLSNRGAGHFIVHLKTDKVGHVKSSGNLKDVFGPIYNSFNNLKVSVSLRNFDIFLSEREREQIKHRVATSTRLVKGDIQLQKRKFAHCSLRSHDSWLGILISVMTPGCHLPLFLKLVRTWASFLSSDLGTRNIAQIFLLSMLCLFLQSKLCLELWLGFNYLSFWMVSLFHKMNGWPRMLCSFSRRFWSKSRENWEPPHPLRPGDHPHMSPWHHSITACTCFSFSAISILCVCLPLLTDILLPMFPWRQV